MSNKPFLNAVKQAQTEKRRLVVPLIGFPGLNLTGCTIKLAQQNYGEHFKVLNTIAEKFKPDAIFPLMDLSVEANALGRYTVFPKEESATVVKDFFSMNDLDNIDTINISYDARLIGYVETLKLMSIGLPASTLRGAYITGPYTLAGLMMGADEAAMATVMRPEMLHQICSFTTEKILGYVRLLIAYGVQIICILEPSAVMLGPDQFEMFSAQYVHQVTQSCRFTDVATVYHICGNTMHLLEKMAKSGVDALSLDSLEAGVHLPTAAKRISSDIIIIGNISPTGHLLTGKPSEVEKDVIDLLKSMDAYPNYILSTGCDLPQETPIDNIQAFMQAGRNYKFN